MIDSMDLRSEQVTRMNQKGNNMDYTKEPQEFIPEPLDLEADERDDMELHGGQGSIFGGMEPVEDSDDDDSDEDALDFEDEEDLWDEEDPEDDEDSADFGGEEPEPMYDDEEEDD